MSKHHLYVLHMSPKDAYATDYRKPYLVWMEISQSQAANKESKSFFDKYPNIEYGVDCYEFTTVRDANSAQQLALYLYEDVDLSHVKYFMTDEELRQYCQKEHLELVY